MLKERNIVSQIGFITVVILTILMGIFGVKDLQEIRKAEKVLTELTRIRIALERYYEITGNYPNLAKENVANDLTLLDYIDINGQKISFAEIYGSKKLAKTLSSDEIDSSNKVIDTNNFKKVSYTGGWNYDYSSGTGEIHANLPSNNYFQGINWNEY